MVPLLVAVILNAFVNGEPTAPACVATMLMLKEPALITPFVTRLLPTMTKEEAFVPDRASVPLHVPPVMVTAMEPITVPLAAPAANEELLSVMPVMVGVATTRGSVVAVQGSGSLGFARRTSL